MARKKSMQNSEFQLQYLPHEVEGECTILAVIPLRISCLKYAAYLLLSVLSLGVLPLFAFWYPGLKRKLCYDFTAVEYATHICIENYDNHIAIVEKSRDSFFDGKTLTELHYFTNRYLKYLIRDNRVEVCQYTHCQDKYAECMSHSAKGWRNEEALQLAKTFGQGAMVIEKPTAISIFVEEIFSPLYIFLIINVLLNWEVEYKSFAVFIGMSAIGGLVITVREVMQVSEKIFAMAYYEVQLDVFREGQVQKVSSLDIVPGDIVFFSEAVKLPFEGVLLEGEMLMNECALTGESIPVAKKGDDLEKYQRKEGLSKGCLLYEGTTILQINNYKPMKVWQKYRSLHGLPVCVTRTNFLTLKGQLIRKILYSNNLPNRFQRESLHFLYFLFAFGVISYLLLCVKLAEVVTPMVLFLRGMDLILIAATPTLPISIIVGIVYAVQSLKRKGIFTIAPNHILEGGSLEVLCFDKTGTLTHDHMDFRAFVPLGEGRFEETIGAADIKRIPQSTLNREKYLANMASNHAIVLVDSTQQLVGDPMEIELLNFSECTIQNSRSSEFLLSFEGPLTKGRVYQRYDFESALQRMSVVASISNGETYVFAKGSPEVMLSIARKGSIPSDYKEKLRHFTSSGFRVLAIASKPISEWKNQSRATIECDLEFNGFQIFENGLKSETKGTIKEFRQNNLNPIMITGDNPITASNIGYQSFILDSHSKTLIVDENESGFSEEEFQFTHEGLEEATFKRPPVKRTGKIFLESESDAKMVYADSLLRKVEANDYNLCLTGAAFNSLFRDIEEGEQLLEWEIDLLKSIQIFARTKPSDKAKVVRLYQWMGKIVGMCGDGANDCDALHQANLGLSLSDTEASIAAAFTAKTRHIGSMLQLIKESRGALATNISLFNINAVNPITQFTSCYILQYFYSYPSQYSFFYWDFFLNAAYMFILGNIATANRLTKERPPKTLFSVANLTQLFVYSVLQLCGQLIAVLAIQGPFADSIDYYSHGGEAVNSARFISEGGDDYLFDSPESNVIFIVANFCYITSIVAFTTSEPWKTNAFKYWPYTLSIVLTLAYTICIAIVPQVRLSLFELVNMTDKDLNLFLLGVGLGIAMLIVLLQKCILIPLFKWIEEDKTESQHSKQ